MPIIILWALTFSSLVYAEENFNPLILRINSALDIAVDHTHGPSCFAGKPTGAKTIEIFEDYAPMEQYQLKEKCIKQICPNIARTRNKSAAEQSPFHASHQIDAKIARLKETLAALFTEVAGLASDHKQWTDQFLKTNIEITDNLAVAGLSSLIENDLSSLAKGRIGKKPSEIDIAKDKSDLLTKYSGFLDPTDAKKLAEFVSAMSTDSRIASTGANYLGAPYRYRMQYPNLNFQNAARQDLKDATAALKSASENVRALAKMTRVDIDLVRKTQNYFSSQTLIDEIEGQDVVRITDQIHRIIVVDNLTKSDREFPKRILGKFLQLSKASPPPTTEKLNELSSGFSKNKLMDMFTVAKQPTKSDDLYRNCLFGFATSAVTLPQKSEIENFNRNLPQMREQIKNAVKGKYSHISGKILDDFIQNTPVFLPPTNESYLSSVEANLKSEIERIKHIRRVGNKSISDAATIEVFSQSGELTNPEGVKALCNRFNFHPVRDNTVTTLGGVALGSESIKDQKFGLGVLAHEMGHNFRTILKNDSRVSSESRDKHVKVESCLSQLHEPFFQKLDRFNSTRSAETKDPRTKFHFVSEDYSDLIGSKVLSDRNFVCEMGPDGMSLGSNSGDLDTHPSLLFRMLHVEAASGRKMPPECKEFIDLNGYNLRSCF